MSSELPISITDELPEFYRQHGGPYLKQLLVEIDRVWSELIAPWRDSLAHDQTAATAEELARTFGWAHVLDLVDQVACPEHLAQFRVQTARGAKGATHYWLQCLLGWKVETIEVIRPPNDAELPKVRMVVRQSGCPITSEHLAVLRALVPAHVACDEASVIFREPSEDQP